MNEKLYMFNPWKIKEWENEQIKEQFDKLTKSYIIDPVSPIQYADNIENLANQLYLIGEMISRLQEQMNKLKAYIKKEESLYIYRERNIWVKENTGKAPAMSYFEAKASEFVGDKKIVLSETESDYTRFKIAYNALEAKMNAVKKKLEAVKYEEFGG